MSQSPVLVAVEVALAYARAILVRHGVPAEAAHTVAEVLLASDMRGIESHGLARLPQYAARLEAGLTDAGAAPSIARQTATTALIDGHNALGPVVASMAMSLAIDKALRHDCGVVSVRGSNHFGIAGYYAAQALPHHLIGLSLTNASPLVVPTHGRERLIGTNPIAVAVPTGDDRPFVLDMATSTVALGKLEVAMRKGEQIPLGWAVDADGQPTTDPVAARQGALLPLGGDALTAGYKGFGLGVLVDLLTGVLAGAQYGRAVVGLFDQQRQSDIGHFFLALNPAAFGDLADFQERARDLLRQIENSERAADTQRIVWAGERERLAMEQARQRGIAYQPAVPDALSALGVRCGLPPLQGSEVADGA